MIPSFEWCLSRTALNEEEARRIAELAASLQLIADVSQSDVFIDCPTTDPGAALVVAQAHPSTFPSMYRTSVVGQLAYARNEPAVLFSLVSGQPVVGSRGISQEQIPIQQNVVPIRAVAGDKVIGALIMERDITEQVERERHVERLQETTEQLGETLLRMAVASGGMQSLMHEGIVLFDESERVIYTNPQAVRMLRDIGFSGSPVNRGVAELFGDLADSGELLRASGIFDRDIRTGDAAFVLKAVPVYSGQRAVGGFMLIRDISELIEKEKKLKLQSAVIMEIHHRVKNNLQTVSSLLRLQMRRTKHAEAQKMVRDSINRINSIAVIHEMLAYEGDDRISFNEVAERIAKNVVSSSARPEQSIRVTTAGPSVSLSSDEATTLALVVNELVQNCVTHAFADRTAGIATISFDANGSSIRMTVTDDGSGIKMTDDPSEKSRKHLGLKIVETLVAENLNGELAMESGENGTAVHIAFPLDRGPRKEEFR